MTIYRASISQTVSARPTDFFELITNLDRLSEWNRAIDHVIATPPEFVDRCQWVVKMRALGGTWDSRSTRYEYDPEGLRFAYISQSDDGNPSRALWTWQLVPIDGGTEVTVDRELHPKTRFRKVIAAPIRHRQLLTEVRNSIAAADALIAADQATRP